MDEVQYNYPQTGQQNGNSQQPQKHLPVMLWVSIILALAIGSAALVLSYIKIKDKEAVNPAPITDTTTISNSQGQRDPYDLAEGLAKIRDNEVVVYRNSLIGFQMVFPAGWYMPVTDSGRPHFFRCGDYECVSAMEMQTADYLISAGGFDTTLLVTTEDKNYTSTLDNLISGARTIKAYPKSKIEGWAFQYIVFFPDHAFVFYTDGDSRIEDILSTFHFTN